MTRDIDNNKARKVNGLSKIDSTQFEFIPILLANWPASHILIYKGLSSWPQVCRPFTPTPQRTLSKIILISRILFLLLRIHLYFLMLRNYFLIIILFLIFRQFSCIFQYWKRWRCIPALTWNQHHGLVGMDKMLHPLNVNKLFNVNIW